MSEKPPKPAAPSKPPSVPVPRDARPAEHVVRLPALRVGQDLVRLVDLLEARLRLGILVDVGVPLLGEPAEGALDLGVVGSPLDAQHLVVVAFGCHGRR